jgi:hypothetical protein
MQVKLDLVNKSCKVLKEDCDPKFQTESTFFYHILQELKKQGYDVIKKRMWKDGHLVDDQQQYIRTRTTNNAFCIMNNEYAICDLGQEFNGIMIGDEFSLPVIIL